MRPAQRTKASPTDDNIVFAHCESLFSYAEDCFRKLGELPFLNSSKAKVAFREIFEIETVIRGNAEDCFRTLGELPFLHSSTAKVAFRGIFEIETVIRGVTRSTPRKDIFIGVKS